MTIGIEGGTKKGKWHGAAFSPIGYKYENDPSYIEKIKEDVKINNEKPRQIELINKRIKELTTQISRYSDLYS